MAEIRIFKNMERLAEFAVQKWVEVSRAAVNDKGFYSVALSGGETPVTFYKKLSEEKGLLWGETHVFMADERFVPYENDANNYHMIKRTLLRHVNIPPGNIHPILTSEISPEAAAERYEQDMITYCRTIGASLPRFDLILLGIGEDGHTASLFPGSPSLKEKRHLAASVDSPGTLNRKRITLTLPVINNSRNIIFIAEGTRKAKIIKEVVEDKNHNLPAARVRPGEGNLFFLFDESAGALLPGRIALAGHNTVGL